MAITDRREPGVYVTIQDTSYVAPTIESGRSVYSVILCDRGPCDQIVHVTSQQQFHNVFGTPNFLRDSQSKYCVDAALLYTSNAYVVRVVPYDAHYANVYIKENAAKTKSATELPEIHGKFNFTEGSSLVKVAVDEGNTNSATELSSLKIGDWVISKFDGDAKDSEGNYIYGLTNAFQIVNMTTVDSDGVLIPTELTLDKAYTTTQEITADCTIYQYVPYEFASRTDLVVGNSTEGTTNVQDYFSTDDDGVVYYFVANGAGKFYNRLAIHGTRNTDLEKIYLDKDDKPLYKYMFSATRSIVK